MNTIFRFSIPFILAFLFLGILSWLAGASSRADASSSAPHETIVVTNITDEEYNNGYCSLREAIKAANTNTGIDSCPAGDAVLTDTINFDVAGIIWLSNQLNVTAGGPLVVDGGNVITTSGNWMTPVWWVEPASELILQNLDVTDGDAPQSDGSGLTNYGNTVIINSTFSRNHAGGASGISNWGIMTIIHSTISGNDGGGISNHDFGILTITNSTLSGNYATTGGGIFNWGSASLEITNSTIYGNNASYGGGIYNYYGGLLFITNSTLSGNNAVNGNGGGIYNVGTLTITNSTFSDNYAWNYGGGISSHTPAILTITNSTLSGNNANNGGGISNSGALEITNSTLAGNSIMYGEGGGIYNFPGYGVAELKNSIVSYSLTGANCAGSPINDGGHNMEDTDTCGFEYANDSHPNTDPILDPLQDNGGPTWTHALLPSSPAIDSGDDEQCPTIDQRGFPRPIDGDGDGEAVCDIGSYELVLPPTLITISGTSEGVLGQVTYFTATVEPISTTLPLEYVWKASGHPPITETMGLTDTVGWTWEVPGTQIITVTASNLAGTVMDTHVITITDLPISDLVASNDSPTLLGSTTTLSATVSTGSNIIYTWDFGDGEVGGGMVVTHIYSDEGMYTATVTATNSANTLTSDTQVTITSAIQTFYLPLVIKSIEVPLAPAPSSFLPRSMVLVGLVVIGETIRWKRRM